MVAAVESVHRDEDSLPYVSDALRPALLDLMASSSRPAEVREEIVVPFEPRWNLCG